jgi:hypothetical protein
VLAAWLWLAEEAGPPLGAVAACAMFVMHGALRKLWEQELHALPATLSDFAATQTQLRGALASVVDFSRAQAAAIVTAEVSLHATLQRVAALEAANERLRDELHARPGEWLVREVPYHAVAWRVGGACLTLHARSVRRSARGAGADGARARGGGGGGGAQGLARHDGKGGCTHARCAEARHRRRAGMRVCSHQ